MMARSAKWTTSFWGRDTRWTLAAIPFCLLASFSLSSASTDSQSSTLLLKLPCQASIFLAHPRLGDLDRLCISSLERNLPPERLQAIFLGARGNHDLADCSNYRPRSTVWLTPIWRRAAHQANRSGRW